MPLSQSSEIAYSPDQFKILSSVGQDLEEFCKYLGTDIHPIAELIGIEPDQFSEFETRISFDRFCRLLESICAIVDDDTVGLQYGVHTKRGATGPFGFGLAAAPNFGEMLKFFAEFAHIVVDMEYCDRIHEKDSFVVEWAYSPLVLKPGQYVDFTASATICLFEEFSRRNVRPLSATLRRLAPSNAKLHHEMFSENLVFGAETNSFRFCNSLLVIENVTANEKLFSYMRIRCAEISASVKPKKNLITALKEDFLKNFESGDTRVEAVASRHGMSERTLQRRLSEINTNYWELFDETRAELSLRFLRETDIPLSVISEKLGYSTQTAYTRAAKRMHGETPKTIRSTTHF